MDPFRLVINGKKIPTKKCFEVLDPASEKPAGLAPLARDQGSRRRGWRRGQGVREVARTCPRHGGRAACMKVAAKIEKKRRGARPPAYQGTGQSRSTALGSRWEIGGRRRPGPATRRPSRLPVKVLQDDSEGKVELHRKPIGVVGSITPWKLPRPDRDLAHHSRRALGQHRGVQAFALHAALDAAPRRTHETRCCRKGWSTALPARTGLGAAMASHDGIGKIVFTGSCATGQKIMAKRRRDHEAADAGARRQTTPASCSPDVDPREIARGAVLGSIHQWRPDLRGAQAALCPTKTSYDDVCDELVAFARKMKVGKGDHGGTW